MRISDCLFVVAVSVMIGGAALAADIEANPENLREIVEGLKPGDTVLLADGEYEGGLVIKASGTKESPVRMRAAGQNVLFKGGRDGVRLEGDYIEVEGLKVTAAQRGGITSGRNTGCAIRKCICFDNGVWGIFSGFSEHLTVEDNECYGSKREHGIYLSNSTDYAIVRRNHCYNNGRCGIQFNGDPNIPGGDGIMSFNLIEGNILHHNQNSLNLTCVADSIIRNNLLYGNTTKAIALWDTMAGHEYASKRNLLINNTIVMDLCSRECIQIRNGSTGNIIRNNILVAPFQAIVCDTSAAEGTVIDHNLYFGGAEPERFIWAGEYRSIRAMRRAGFCEGAIEGDPKFADGAKGDFRVVADSPAVGAGAADERAGSADLAGNARVSGKGIDVGAYEFQAAE